MPFPWDDLCLFFGIIMFLTTVSLNLSSSVLRLKTALSKRTGRPEVEMEGPEEGLGRRRSSRIMEETSGMEEEEEEETTAAVYGRKGRRDGEVPQCPRPRKVEENQYLFLKSDNFFFSQCPLVSLQIDATTSSIPELERHIEKLSKVL